MPLPWGPKGGHGGKGPKAAGKKDVSKGNARWAKGKHVPKGKGPKPKGNAGGGGEGRGPKGDE
jgi:hypothetical protein